MGKGGDASATASSRMALKSSGKAEKYTWAEVKKHVSHGEVV